MHTPKCHHYTGGLHHDTNVQVKLPHFWPLLAVLIFQLIGMTSVKAHQLYAFGDNREGQLGLGAAVQVARSPTRLQGQNSPWGSSPITAVVTGLYHTLILAGGRLYGTGNNSVGQLGLGTPSDHVMTPVLLENSAPWKVGSITDIAVGQWHSLVVAAGTLFSFGSNDHGQLGLDNTVDYSTPQILAGASAPWGTISVTAIAAGYRHSILNAGGQLYVFGRNKECQLGLNTSIPRYTLPQILDHAPWGKAAVTIIAANGHYSLVVAGGQLYSFGSNFYGQLGLADITSVYCTPTLLYGPNAPWGNDIINALTAGAYQAFILAGGKVYGMGRNHVGQLGLGTTRSYYTTPQLLQGLSAPWGTAPVVQVAAGSYHTVFLAGGTVYGSGDNSRSQLGISISPTEGQTNGYTTPQLLGGDSAPWSQGTPAVLAAGGFSTLVTAEAPAPSPTTEPIQPPTQSTNPIMLSNQVYAFGDNSHGQLGMGTLDAAPSGPQLLEGSNAPWGSSSVTAIAIGMYHTLLLAGGQLYAVGNNTAGQLGLGMTSIAISSPQLLTGPSAPWGTDALTAIAVGLAHSLVVAGGQLYSFGANTNGQLGLADMAGRSLPVLLAGDSAPWGMDSVTSVAAGFRHSLALAGSQLFAFGHNAYCQLGLNNTTPHYNIPQLVSSVWGDAPINIIASGGYYSMVVAGDKLYTFGLNNYGQLGHPFSTQMWCIPEALEGDRAPWGTDAISALAAGAYQAFVLAAGKVYAVGRNHIGQLGLDNTRNYYDTFQLMAEGSAPWEPEAVTDVAAGAFHTIILAGGKVYGHGDNALSELGLPQSPTSGKANWFSTPQLLTGESSPWILDSVTAVSAGGFCTMVVADVPQPSPSPIGTQHAETLAPDRQLYSFGDNLHGQLALGVSKGIYPTPQLLYGRAMPWGSASVTAVAIGLYHTIILVGGQLFAAGRNFDGQLGLGMVSEPVNRPQVLSGASTPWGADKVTAFAVGQAHTLVVAGGSLYSFGANGFGQLGLGNSENQSLPRLLQGSNAPWEPESVTAAAAGYKHSAVLAGSQLYTFGDTSHCQLGINGTALYYDTPQLLSNDALPWNDTAPTIIAANGYQTLFVVGGRVYGLGSNFYGQLGHPIDQKDFCTPIEMISPWGTDEVTALVAGPYQTFVIAGGKLYGVGRNHVGQLGVGTTRSYYEVPQLLTGASAPWGIADITSLAAGAFHTLVLAGGRVYGHGDNTRGQLGLVVSPSSGITNGYSTPQLLAGDWDFLNPSAVAAGGFCSMVIADVPEPSPPPLFSAPPSEEPPDRQLYAFGDNTNGELALDLALGMYSTPQVLHASSTPWGSTDVTAVVLGMFHTIILVGGQLYTAGNNSHGQLGLGFTSDPLSVPQVLSGGNAPWGADAISGIAAGLWHSLVVAGGKLYAFGDNQFGQLGLGDVPGYTSAQLLDNSSAPWQGDGVTAIAAGIHHSVVLAGSQLYAFGSNLACQLGLGGDVSQFNIPQPVSGDSVPWGDSTVTIIAAGGYYTLLLAGDTLYGFGSNFYGQLGHPISTTQFCTPTAIVGPRTLWGTDTVTSVVAGAYQAFVIAGGRLYGFGRNNAGQLGVGTTRPYYDVPRALSGDTSPWGNAPVMGVAAGLYHTLILAGGRVYGQGDNGRSQLGLAVDPSSGVSNAYTTPQLLTGPWDPLSPSTVAAGGFRSMIIADVSAPSPPPLASTPATEVVPDRQLYAFGEDSDGQLGLGHALGTYDAPQVLSGTGAPWGSASITAVVLGSAHSLILVGQDMYATGNNTFGQLGLGTMGDHIVSPRQLAAPWGADVITGIAAGMHHSLVVAGGKLFVFGSDAVGQLGLGGGMGRSTPEPLSDVPWSGASVASVAAGFKHSVVLAGFQLYTFGKNTECQLGLGHATPNYATPQLVTQGNAPWGEAAVTMIAAAGDYTLVLAGGKVYGFGSNFYGQLAHPIRNTTFCSPVVFEGPGAPWGIDVVAAIVPGPYHAFILAGNKLYAVGRNDAGQLGLSNTRSYFDSPQHLTGQNAPWEPANVVSVDAGLFHSIILAGGKVYGSGANTHAQLGLPMSPSHGNANMYATPQLLSGPWDPLSPSAVAAGGFFSMVIADVSPAAPSPLAISPSVPDRQLFSFGDNAFGQLALGVPPAIAILPQLVTGSQAPWGSATVSAAVMGVYHTLILVGTDLYVAGNNSVGQLGLGSASDPIGSPQLLSGSSAPWGTQRITGIAVGLAHSLVVAGGNVYAFGSNVHGQLGLGTTISQSLPTLLQGDSAPWDTTVVAVAAGFRHSVILAGSQLFTVGQNIHCQLGIGSLTPYSATPQLVMGGHVPWGEEAISIVAAGGYYNMLVAGGKVYSFGSNFYGQLGQPVQNITFCSPTEITAIWGSDTVSGLAVGSYHAFIVAGGKLYGVGRNNVGQLGVGTSRSYYNTPQLLSGISAPWGNDKVADVAAGMYHTLILAGGKVYGQGDNARSQLGFTASLTRGSNYRYTTPQLLTGAWDPLSPSAVIAGGFSSMVIADVLPLNPSPPPTAPVNTISQQLFGFGDDTDGQLGLGELAPMRSAPQLLYGSSAPWGSAAVTAVAAGMSHSLLVAGGQLYAAGNNSVGQLGLGTSGSPVRTPQLVAGGNVPWGVDPITMMALGAQHSLLAAGGRLYAFGGNAFGQLGLGDTADRNAPQLLEDASAPWGAEDVLMVAAGFRHSIVLAGSQLYAFGHNLYCQLGLGKGVPYSTTPQAVAGSNAPWGDSAITAIAAAGYFTLVLAGGKLYTFGSNAYGQLAQSISDTTYCTPSLVNGTSAPWGSDDVTAVAAGAYHAFILAGGNLYGVGRNQVGQLGIGTMKEFYNIPQLLSGVSAPWGPNVVTGLAAGAFHSAFLAGGEVYLHGDNTHVQLGITYPLLLVRSAGYTAPQQLTGPWVPGSVTTVVAGGYFTLVIADAEATDLHAIESPVPSPLSAVQSVMPLVPNEGEEGTQIVIWPIILGSVLGGVALLGIVYCLWRSGVCPGSKAPGTMRMMESPGSPAGSNDQSPSNPLEV